MNSKFRIQQRIKEHSTRRRLFESKSLGRIGTLRGSSWLAHAIRQHTRPRPVTKSPFLYTEASAFEILQSISRALNRLQHLLRN